MSNTYMNELEQALKKVNDQLGAAELNESNKADSAKINLYYAQGITEQASEKLSMDQLRSKVSGKQYQAATNIFRVTENIVTDANAAVLDAGNTTSTVSTAATSFQTAANALTNLWADTAAVLAVATSVDNHDKIKDMAQTANALTERAAKSAETATLISLNTTIDASQSRAANVVSQSEVVKNNMQNLEKSLSDGFATLQDQVNTDLDELAEAIESESQKAGAFNVAEAEELALKSSESFMNKEVNHNLNWQAGDGNYGDNFILSFDAFKEKETIVVADNCEVKKSKPKAVIQEYRVMIVSADEAPSFDIQIAKSVSNVGKVKKYKAIEKLGKDLYQEHYYLTEYFAMNPATDDDNTDRDELLIAYDYLGKAVKRGVNYNFFVYAIYTPEYQAATGDTDGYLSLASPTFVNTAPLPSPAASNGQDACDTTDNIHLSFGVKDNSSTVKVSFKVPKKKMILPNTVNLEMFMDFRVFLFSEENHQALCQNLQIRSQTQVVNDSRQNLDDSLTALQESEEKYNEAAAAGADKDTLTRLQEDITTNQQQVENDEKTYLKNVETLNELYVDKISNFYIDDTVLQNVPPAYGLLATQSKADDYPDKLEEELNKLRTELSTLEENINEKLSENKTLEAEVKKKTKASEKASEKIDALQKENSELDAKVYSDFRELERISEIEDLILELEYLLGLPEKLPSELKKEEKELIDAITADLKTMKQNKDEINKLMAENIRRQKQINDLNSEITLNNTQIQIYESKILIIPGEIENVEKEIEKLKEEEAGEDNLYFVASNEFGDFTNNYGEPLLPGKMYTALVFSVIKEAQSEVAAQYQSVYSKFSEPQKYNFLLNNK